MRNQFVGDIGDFAKYGLLRALVRHGAAARLGVVWYANDDDPKSTHGSLTSCLEDDAGAYRHCDLPLHSTLRSLIAAGSRRIIAVEASGVLGVDTPYWSELTPDSYPQRLNWTVGALNRVKGCDLVLLDPDRGAVSAEHAYQDEIRAFSGQAGVAVIYHTPSRHAKGVTHEDQIEHISRSLTAVAEQGRVVYAARWPRHGARTFLIVCNSSRSEAVRNALQALCRSPWGQPLQNQPTEHFTFSGPGLELPMQEGGL